MRVFVALLPSADSVLKLKPLLHQVTGSHHPEDLHMTLYFAGKASIAEVEGMIQALNDLPKLNLIYWEGSNPIWFPSKDVPKVWAFSGSLNPALTLLLGMLDKRPEWSQRSQEYEFIPHVSVLDRQLASSDLTALDFKLASDLLSRGIELEFDRIALMQSMKPMAKKNKVGGSQQRRYQTIWQRHLSK